MVVTGTSDDGVRLDAARAIGARHVVAVDRDDVKAVVADLTAGRGADVVFDVASVPQTVPTAVDLVRVNGRILLAGLKHFEAIPGLVTDLIVLKALQIFGGSGYTPESMGIAVAMIESGKVRSDLVVGGRHRGHGVAGPDHPGQGCRAGRVRSRRRAVGAGGAGRLRGPGG